jgi:hypothetical protein
MNLFIQPLRKSATNPSLENASCSTKGKKEWTRLERLQWEHKSLIQLYHLREEQIVELEIREIELMEQVESLESSMKKLIKGEHKEMLFHHVHDYGKRGLRSFPETNKGTIPSSEIKPSFVKNISSYYQHCQVTGHHTRECPLPTIPKNSTMYENNHFLLSKVKGQVKARFIVKLTTDEKKKLHKQLWVPKALVTQVQGPKLGWVPKTKA